MLSRVTNVPIPDVGNASTKTMVLTRPSLLLNPIFYLLKKTAWYLFTGISSKKVWIPPLLPRPFHLYRSILLSRVPRFLLLGWSHSAGAAFTDFPASPERTFSLFRLSPTRLDWTESCICLPLYYMDIKLKDAPLDRPIYGNLGFCFCSGVKVD